MNILTKDWDKLSYDILIELECEFCFNKFKRTKRHVRKMIRLNANALCSDECFSFFKEKKKNINCTCCNRAFVKKSCQIKKYKNHFCSQSCAATYQNAHKTHGTRRSKLEVWLEKQLTEKYPELEIKFNSKEAINSELDIYIPLLKIAFELNGIFHYEAIYGQDKLEKIQNNDNRKFQACIEHGISLCIIDASQQKYFKETTSQKYLKIITDIINANN